MFKVLCSAIVCLSVAGSSSAAECDMALGWEFRSDSQAPVASIYKATDGIPSIFYRADMDVNTDGGPRSYHPDDPRGKTKALNNIVNAISGIYSSYGGKWIGCKPKSGDCFDTYVSVFEEARNAAYNASAGTRWVMTEGMIPWKYDPAKKRQMPCIVTEGKYKGYFVSQTAYTLRAGDKCDPARYLDSVAINANVLPQGTHWESGGVLTDGFDLVVVVGNDDRVAFGVNGDRGPATSIGEVSVAMAAEMNAVELSGNETYQQVKGLALNEVSYLIFPKIDIKRMKGSSFKQEDVDQIGKQAFQDWGGMERLRDCRTMLKKHAEK